MDERREDEHERPKRRLSLWQVTKSILGAAIGVQSEDVRKRDFKQDDPTPFIIGGIVFTVLFIIALVVIVQIIVSKAGVS